MQFSLPLSVTGNKNHYKESRHKILSSFSECLKQRQTGVRNLEGRKVNIQDRNQCIAAHRLNSTFSELYTRVEKEGCKNDFKWPLPFLRIWCGLKLCRHEQPSSSPIPSSWAHLYLSYRLTHHGLYLNTVVSTCNAWLCSVFQQTPCYTKQIVSLTLGEPLHSKDGSLVICFLGRNTLFSEFIGSNSYLGTANLNSVIASFFPSPKKTLVSVQK